MKIKASFQGHDKWVQKALSKISPITASSMAIEMSILKGRIQYQHLRGPYPTKLSFHTGGRTSGNLKDNIQVEVVRELDDVIGIVGVPSTAWYGKVWEAVDEYKHRKGMTFKNGNPMARPFASPAYDEMEKEFKRNIKDSLIRGLNL